MQTQIITIMEPQIILKNAIQSYKLSLQQLLFPNSDGAVSKTHRSDHLEQGRGRAIEDNEDLLDDNNGLRIKYAINQDCRVSVMDYELIAAEEFMEEERGEEGPISCFYYTLLDRKWNLVATGYLPELDALPFVENVFFDISLPLRNRAKRIKFYRNDLLLISHIIPTSELKLNVCQH